MKKILILTFAMMLLLCACNDTPRIGITENGQTFEEYMENVSLPDGLTINFKPSQVTVFDSAKVYSAKLARFTVDDVAPVIMFGNVTESTSYAEGMQYISVDDALREYLTIYDGGKSFGTDCDIDGGFGYVAEISGEALGSKLRSVILVSPGLSVSSTEPYLAPEDYTAGDEITSLGFEPAVSTVMETLSKAGAPELKLTKYYCLDLQTMVAHAALNNYDYSYSEEDEGYLFFFSQVVDGIPIINSGWTGKGGMTATGNYMKGTQANVYYTSKGIVDAQLVYFHSVLEDGKSVSLITPNEAFNCIAEYFSGVILDHDYSITSMELNYISVPIKDKFQLRPAWVFCIAELQDGKIFDYDYYVIDALTCEILSA